MSSLSKDRFGEFFQELHGYAPYPWQQRLADRVVDGSGDWPDAIDLPTGSGKTACLDVAVFALACQSSREVSKQSAPRRIFFCVNRRVIVDEAFQRAGRIAKRIWAAERDNDDTKPALRDVATALRKLSGTTDDDAIPPLDAMELRGGIYRDNRWARSATQPTIVCTTLDQLGSRLLFRGYGVSRGAAPIQAALIAYESLILLDEAHISRPFLQTLENVRRYLDPEKWAEQDIGISPMRAVPMTATPPVGVGDKIVLRLMDEDRKNEILSNRLKVSKPAELKQVTDVAKAAEKEVCELLKAGKGQPDPKPVSVGIIVNRVATARNIYNLLCENQRNSDEKKRKISRDFPIELVIGSMRPIDRDRQTERLRSLIGPDRPAVSKQTSFVIATQCLEVGADYDFDILVTECASLDALRQRFGRLNRAGRDIDTKAVILAKQNDIKDASSLDENKPRDPIYGNALARTWNWLWEHPSRTDTGTQGKKTVERHWIDFGIDAMDKILKGENGGRIPENLLAPSASLDAPVMLPAYVDFWCQTAPKPVPDPDVSLFIHGVQDSEPDVQICWRADLTQDNSMNHENWCDVVALLPPSSAECMSVPVSRVRRWLNKQEPAAEGDMLGVVQADPDDKKRDHRPADSEDKTKYYGILWRGPTDSIPLSNPSEIRPGDTLVLLPSATNVEQLGHIPGNPATLDDSPNNPERAGQDDLAFALDMAEAGFRQARDRESLRIHRSLRAKLPRGDIFDDILDRAIDQDNAPSVSEWQRLLREAAETLNDPPDGDIRRQLEALANSINGLRIDFYPDKQGVVLTTRNRLGSQTDWFIPALDDGSDDVSTTYRTEPVGLSDHTGHVVDRVQLSADLISVTDKGDLFRLAAKLHDLGKADERFQAMLRRTDRTDAWLLAAHASALLAKSDGIPQSRSERIAARLRSGLPNGFRHEMLSLQLAERSNNLPTDPGERDLVLHLIAAHHGHARPFAPVVLDEKPPGIEVDGLTLTPDDRLACPPHRLDSGIAERFWSLTRRYGWWGLAYLESILRLADQQASAAEDVGVYESTTVGTQESVGATI